MSNIKKFKSLNEYEGYRFQDGWDYPSVCWIENGIGESTIHYNNEFIMRWNDNDTAKTPTFLGDISRAQFRDWVDNASVPVEVSKNTHIVEDLGGDAVSGHHSDSSYLQMAEIQNINVGLFEDSRAGTKEVRFNFDHGCPKGFHKWFAHPVWNQNRSAWVKLISRYNCYYDANGYMNNQTGQGHTRSNDNYCDWSANDFHAANIQTGLMEITWWEQLVLKYIICAYHGTFDIQSVYQGWTDMDEENCISGLTDTSYGLNEDAHGVDSTTGGYKFMWLENPVHGDGYLWCSGATNKNSQLYITFDDIKASQAAVLSESNADLTFKMLPNNGYIKKINLLGIPTELGASDTTGFYDYYYSWASGDTPGCFYAGGDYGDGSYAGAWQLYLNNAFDGTASDFRARSTFRI